MEPALYAPCVGFQIEPASFRSVVPLGIVGGQAEVARSPYGPLGSEETPCAPESASCWNTRTFCLFFTCVSRSLPRYLTAAFSFGFTFGPAVCSSEVLHLGVKSSISDSFSHTGPGVSLFCVGVGLRNNLLMPECF